MSDPVVSVIIITYNQSQKTAQCFRSIRANCSTPHEIIWVDNGSHPREFEAMKKEVIKPRVKIKLIKFKTNKGFVEGVNAALPEVHKRAKYIILLNNDTEVGPETFQKLIKPLDQRKVGITSCVTQSKISWQEAVNLNRRWPSLKIPPFNGKLVEYTKVLEKRFPEKCIDVRDLNFAFFCAAFRRDVLINELGGLDKDFVIGLGEDDFACHKARSLGYKLYLVLDAFVYHHHRTTFKALEINIDNLRKKNLVTLRRKIKELKPCVK